MQKTLPGAARAGGASPDAVPARPGTTLPILFGLSLAHLLNDMMQSLVPAIYPIIKETHGLDFGQIGLITFTFQLTASLFQPAVGFYTDKRPMPYSMVMGMAFTLIGLIVLAWAPSYMMLILGAAMSWRSPSKIKPRKTTKQAKLTKQANA